MISRNREVDRFLIVRIEQLIARSPKLQYVIATWEIQLSIATQMATANAIGKSTAYKRSIFSYLKVAVRKGDSKNKTTKLPYQRK